MRVNKYELLTSEAMRLEGRFPSRKSFVFGMHKGGSTMLHQFFRIVTQAEKIKAFNVSRILFENGISDIEYSFDLKLAPFFDERLVYYGFRYCPAFMLSQKYRFLNQRAIILIRDPRDCVVSAYYSFLNSHPTSNVQGSNVDIAISTERERHKASTIDHYCENEMYRFTDELLGYAWFLHENVKMFRYEDIIFSKQSFLKECIEYLDLDISKNVFDEALRRVDVVPKKESVGSHIRSVHPENYKKKLKPETIEYLNYKFSDVLDLFGYI